MKSKHLLLMLLIALLAPWAANAQVSVPYTEGFEDYSSGLPTGWTKVGDGTVAVQTSQYHDGSKSLRFSGATSNVVALPAFDVEVNTLQISFWSKAEGSYSQCGYFDVGYVTDLNDASTFVQLQSDYYSGFTSYASVDPVSMASAPAGAYIAFRHRPTSTYYYWFVDDITVEALPACPYPTGLQANGVTHEEATITWTSTESAWQVVYSTDENFDPNAASPISVNSASCPLDGLTPLTDYYVYVRSNCTASGNGYSDWSSKLHFSTTAVATVVGDSWSDDFEGASCGWELVNGTLANKWCWGTATSNGGTHAIYVSSDDGASTNYSASNSKIFATKLLQFADGKYEFSYDWLCKGESTYDFLRVALVPASQTLTAGTDYSTIGTTSLPSGWIALDGGGKLNLQEAWQTKVVAINVAAGNYYMVLVWRNDSGVYPPGAAVDNVSITRVACPYDVAGLAVDQASITTNGATISWTAGEATQWQVAYSANSTFEGATEEIVSTASYNMTGLTAATTYYVRVRAYCGGSDYGSWSDAINFPTACDVVTIDENHSFAENFDGYTVVSTNYPSSRVLPICWDYKNTSTYSSNKWYPTISYYSYTDYSHSPNNYLRFYVTASSGSNYDPQDQYAILPEMNNVSGLRIKLYARANSTGTNYDATFKVGVMEGNTFVQVGDPINPTSTTYEQYIIPFSSYTGEGNRIAIKVDAVETPASGTVYRSVFIDDITVELIPNCLEPTDLAVVDNSITTNSVQLSWTTGGTETMWDVYCTTSDVAPTAETTPTVTGTYDMPCTVSGLTSASHYFVYVRSRCSASDLSPWTSAVEFDTECEAMTVDADHHYNQDFDSYAAGSTSTSIPATYPDDNLPLCWQFLNRSDNSSSYPQVFLSSSNSYAVSGNCLFFKSSSSTPLYAILPEFSNNTSDLMLTFTYRNEGTGASNGTLYVSYMTDPTDASTFSTEDQITCSQTTTLTEKEVFFPNAPAGSYIAFKYQGGSSNNYYLSIDNVSVEPVPTCRKPSTLACDSKTAHTATLSWTENGSATAWQVSYSTDANFDPEDGTIVDVNANPGTISGLAQSTTYYAYVRANCGNSDYSVWNTTKATFSTLSGHVTPTGLTVDNSTITSSQATASWNDVAGNTLHQSYDIYWALATVTEVPAEPTAPNLISGITATSQVISGLEAETTYKVWVRDNCGSDGYSNWSSAVTFATAANCQMPDGLAASNLTNNSATISWNTYGQSGFNLRYSTDGENWTTVNNVSSPYTFNGTLSSNTAYQVQVQATCNTEAWSSTLEFTTLCDPVTISAGHPWTEDFEAPVTTAIYNTNNAADLVVPDCWDNYTSNNGYVYYIPHIIKSDAGSSGYNYSNPASQVLYFYGQGNSYAALPFFSNALNELQISFKWATEGSSQGTLTLGYITAEDNGTYNTFTQIGASYNANSQSQHQMKSETVYLNNVPNTATRLVFRWYYSGWYGVNIDDIEVSMAPSCYPVGTLTNANEGPHSVELSWTLIDNTQDAWVVEYADNSEFNNNQSASANTHTDFELAGLTPETHYWVRVKADCGNSDYGEVSNVVDFTTGIACHAPTDLAASNETTTSMDLSWTNGEVGQEAWVIAYKKEGDANFTEVAVTSNPYTLTGLTDGKTYTLKVRANCGNVDGLSQWSDAIEHATVASCPTPTNVAYSDVNPHGATITWDGEAANHNIEYRTVTTAEVNETYDFEDGTQGWTTIDADGHGEAWSRNSGSSYANSGNYSMKASYNYSYAHQDYLVSPQITLGGTFSFYAKKGGSYNDCFRVYLSTTGNASASDFTIELTNGDETPTTTYTQYSYDLSSYSGMGYVAIVYTAPANQLNLYIDDINITSTIISGYGAWQTVDDVTSPYELNILNPETVYEVHVVGDCGATTSPHSDVMTFTTGIACYAPENFAVDLSTVTHNSVELSWTATGGTSAWVVAYKADGDANFTEVENVTENAPYRLEGLDPETHYTVKVKSDCGSEGYSSWSEEKTFTTIEACAAPTAFVLDNVAAHQATFSWTAGNGNTAWKVYVKEHAAAEYPSTYTNATTASVTISSLDDATAYDVKIVPTCDENKILEVENAFTTLCEAVTTFPWTEDFNSLTEINTIPVCWNNEEGTTTNANYKWCYTTTTGNGGCNGTGHNGSNCVRFDSYNNSKNNTNFLKSPVLSLPAGQPLQLKFWYKNPTGGDFSVYISTDGGTTHETALATGLTGASGWTGHEAIDLSAYAGQDVVIVFKGTSNYGNGNAYIYLDDVTVEPLTIEKIVDLNKWYAISSPMNAPSVSSVTNLTNGTYDLFRYDEPTGTWQNYKASNFDFENGRGYIYRRTTSAILTFNGIPNVSDVSYNLTASCADATLKGFNLVGNPYKSKAGISTSCYTLNANGTWTVHESYEIEMTEGVMVHTNSATALQFNAISSKSAPTATEALAITVSGNGYEDIVYARLEDGEGMPKLGHLNADAPALSIPVDGSRYAIAMLGNETESFPLTLQAAAGTYTIGIKGSDNMSYVHLLDRATGRDIDLLRQAYTFSTTGNDANRFMVKLSAGLENASSEIASWNGTGWAIYGTGTLQVFDVLGRRIASYEINGEHFTLSAQQFPSTGVYVLRMGEKSQKIVVK